jgi:hypothetical protein
MADRKLEARLMSCVAHGATECMAIYRGVASQMQDEQDDWVSRLRACGVKAAHPDDGWVNRQENTVTLQYPQYDDGAGVGDLVALGWPYGHRLVRLTERVPLWYSPSGKWKFEEAESHE